MSYSFSVRAPNHAEAIAKVDDELAKVVETQPVHRADSVQAREAALAFVDVLPKPSSDQDVCISVNGSLGWNGLLGTPEMRLTSASVSVQASLIAKEKL